MSTHGYTGRFIKDHCVYGQASIVLSDDMAALSKWSSNASDTFSRKTKLICTMGPSCWDVDTLVKMIDQGMNVARLNFSHGDFEAHGATVQRIREALKQRPGKHVAILLDTKGPEIRTGFFKEEGGKVKLEAGQELVLTTDYDYKGDSTKIACSYAKLPQSVKPGSTILMADGTVSLEVIECLEDSVRTRVMNNATIGERKNMNLPGVRVDLPCISEKDKNDILNFGIPQGVNFIAASFVQDGDDVRGLRKLLGPRGRHIKIISKIENESGMKHFDDILAASDGIMIARGDLGMEIPPEKVFLAQKMMTGRCNLMGKPVITATQMLESMVTNPRPTRAEASDVANAVLDGTDAVMLSGESAGGAFPVQAVSIMRRICEEAESCIDYDTLFQRIRETVMNQNDGGLAIPEAVCSSAVKACIECNATLIVALTETGATAKLLSKYRPSPPILALSASESTIKHLQLYRGIVALQVPSFQGTDHVIRNALEHAKQMGLCSVGDKIVAVHGVKEEVSGSSNLMKVLEVD
ncbi:hypothetical protein FOZ62_032062 [Perkinsus olseni]|uniref:Pyruvate kinase n=2 Tax=Perkinsus olseni TaxID=32597 RepID=A0A7J6RXT1_PEROL|nr:hypothetical protein FOZ62_032062 [Perkinsus olseni]